MSISILCVHGVNHGDLDPDLEGSWSKAICDGLVAWNPKLQGAITCDFLKYDSLFEQAPLNPASYAQAFAELLASGIIHGIGDLFSRERGLFEVPDKIRWTAGMVAQWVSDDDLKSKARDHILKQMNTKSYDLVCAHNPSLAEKGDTRYLGSSGASYRIGRAISLRSMAKKQYDATRKTLKHHGPYLPIILEACQEEQLSYEYRHGTQSYGAFTYSLAATLRESRRKKANPSFVQVMDGVKERLKKLKYPQVPNLVGAREVLREGVPWGGKAGSAKGKRGKV